MVMSLWPTFWHTLQIEDELDELCASRVSSVVDGNSPATVQRSFRQYTRAAVGTEFLSPYPINLLTYLLTYDPTANLQYTQLVKYPHTSTSTRQQYSSTAEVPVQVPVLQPCSSMWRIEVESLFQMTGPICPLPRSSAPWLGLCLGLRVMVTVRVGV